MSWLVFDHFSLLFDMMHHWLGFSYLSDHWGFLAESTVALRVLGPGIMFDLLNVPVRAPSRKCRYTVKRRINLKFLVGSAAWKQCVELGLLAGVVKPELKRALLFPWGTLEILHDTRWLIRDVRVSFVKCLGLHAFDCLRMSKNWLTHTTECFRKLLGWPSKAPHPQALERSQWTGAWRPSMYILTVQATGCYHIRGTLDLKNSTDEELH